KRIAVDGMVADGVRGLYMFRTLDGFLGGRPDLTRIMSAEANVDFGVSRGTAFAQDHWTPSAALTVDAGLRFDASAFPSSLDIRSRQLTPRIGVAWTVTPQWLVRGGAGLFADRLVLASIERALATGEPGVVERIGEAHDAGVPSIYTVRRGAWNPSSVQASVGAERLITSNLTAAVTYLYSSGCHLPRTVNVNLPPPTILTAANAPSLGVDAPTAQQLGRPIFGPERLNPAWDGIFELQPTAASTYHGVTLSLNRRLAN